MDPHPIQQAIKAIDIDTIPDVQGGYMVGRNNVTRIEACEKPGPYGVIPYVRVWAGETCLAEFCQHNIVGVYFDAAPPAAPSPPDGRCHLCGGDHDPDDCIPF
ncbi:hypothetical protein [Rhizorhabdus wittichii]|jgi:hypothetical protein|uniref:hypothetical protein n=1 Tax=Rhizorhabdus wittichii TaxID=160791 RepID=UPI00031D319E|nr:hypothetical protein [Rhizorhabdus wittichii]